MARTLLLTGPTGRLGGALLERLARRDDVDRVVALSRRPPAGPAPAKLEFVRADLREGLPLDPDDEITAIVHGAADTRFSAPLDEARAVNVEGTRRLLAFAARCRRLERFLFLSTVHVAGRRTGVILERELEHDAGFVNAYEQSKYEAERMLAGYRSEVPIMVCRLSTVLGDSVSGAVLPGAIHQAIRFFYQSLAPMIPGEPESPVDLISSDYAVDAIVASLDGFEAGGRRHVCAGADAMPLAELLELTRETFVCYRPSWRKRAVEMPAITDLPTFELFVRSVEEIGTPALRQCVGAIRDFVPQMAYPKRFDDAECARALARNGIRRSRLRDFYPRIVRRLMAPSPEFTRLEV